MSNKANNKADERRREQRAASARVRRQNEREEEAEMETQYRENEKRINNLEKMVDKLNAELKKWTTLNGLSGLRAII